MAILDSNLPQAFTPEAYGALVDLVIAEKSIAFQAGTIVPIVTESIRFPLLTADPGTGWVAEGATIPLTDPTTSEIVVTPKKVAGRTLVSNEAASDTNPAVANMTGQSLGRSVAKKVDAAFFGNTVANGPSGLLSVSGVNVVDTGPVASLTNVDVFHQAKADALADGATITVFILAADVALALSKAKEGTGSNKGLFESIADGVTLAGVPVLVSTDVPAGNAWGLDSSQTLIVQRTGTIVATSADASFGEDAVQVRATARVGFGFANPAGIVRLYDSA